MINSLALRSLHILIFQDIVLKALKKGETPEAIGRRIQEYVYTHFGLKMGKVNMEMMVPAYIGYCKKKGLA